MKKSTVFLLILVSIFFTSTLALLYINLNLSHFVSNNPQTITETVSIASTEALSPTGAISSDYLLEDWSTYSNVDNFLSWDECGPEDNSVSTNIKQKISSLAKISEKTIDGLKIVNTPTLGFTNTDLKQFNLCQAGAFSPLTVLPSRILWTSPCSTGIAPNNSKCEETLTKIRNLYK